MSKPVILLVLVALGVIFIIIMYCFLKKAENDLELMLSVIDKLDGKAENDLESMLSVIDKLDGKTENDLDLMLSAIDKLDGNEHKRKIATYRKDEIAGYLSGFIALCLLVTAFYLSGLIVLCLLVIAFITTTALLYC